MYFRCQFCSNAYKIFIEAIGNGFQSKISLLFRMRYFSSGLLKNLPLPITFFIICEAFCMHGILQFHVVCQLCNEVSSLSHIATLHFLQSIEIIYGSFYKLSHARKFLTQKIYHIVFALFLKILEFPSGPSINKVRTLKFGDFRHHLPSCTLLNNRMKSENRCRPLP